MSQPFIGEIKMFGGNFAPRGWALCDGQFLAINGNEALFSLLGTTYGGDGRTTFGLPELRGRAPMHHGSGPGLTPRNMGARFGAESVTVTVSEMPAHSHSVTNLQATGNAADTSDPTGNSLAMANVYHTGPANAQLSEGSVSVSGTAGNAGGNQSHANMPPYSAVNFIIALSGVYPPRS